MDSQEISIAIENEAELVKIALDDFLGQQAEFKKMLQASGESASYLIAPNERDRAAQPARAAASSAARQ